MSQPWDSHRERIDALMERYPGSDRILRFYRRVVGFQYQLAEHIEKRKDQISVTSIRDIPGNLHEVMSFFPIFLDVVAQGAPAALALGAKDLSGQSEAWQEILNDYLLTGMPTSDSVRRYLIKIFLQPLMVRLSLGGVHGVSHSAEATLRNCPFCGEYPAAGCIKPSEDPGRQFMICSLCFTEWRVPRWACLFCNETRPGKLPQFSMEDVSHVQISACDSCKRYLKVVDLGSDPEAIPIVEDLATPDLDTTMRQRGYQRHEVNLAGV